MIEGEPPSWAWLGSYRVGDDLVGGASDLILDEWDADREEERRAATRGRLGFGGDPYIGRKRPRRKKKT